MTSSADYGGLFCRKQRNKAACSGICAKSAFLSDFCSKSAKSYVQQMRMLLSLVLRKNKGADRSRSAPQPVDKPTANKNESF